MKRTMKTAVAFLLVLAMASSISFAAPAAKTLNNGAKALPISKSAKNRSYHTSFVDTSLLRIMKPSKSTVYYKGEKISVSLRIADVWVYYWTCPGVILRRLANDKIVAYRYSLTPVPNNSRRTYSFSVSTKKLKTGKYSLLASAIPVDEYGNLPSDFEDWSYYDIPTHERFVYVKILRAPKKVKASPGYKKIGISFGKATGAKKYQIYRSTKKSGGYKLIKTTSKTKYTDKKVKRYRKYYYKVKSVRTVRGTVKSGYSSKVSARAW